jgi:transposase
MTDVTTAANRMTIGIDLGDRFSHFCVLDEAGETIEEGRLAMTEIAFRRRFETAPAARIAIEVGTHSPWVDALLTKLGHEVLVANPRKLRMIFKSDRKNDRLDAEQLARVARLDPKLLSPIAHRERSTRADLAVARARDTAVAARTRMVNHVRGCLKSFAVRLPKCSTRTFPRRVVAAVPKELRPALVPLLRMIGELTERIVAYEKRIERLSKERYPETALLRQVNGVGAVTALTFVLTLEEPRRFRSSRSVGAYLGLRPKQRQSGASDPELRISKAGDRDLRRLLVQSAQYMLGPFGCDSDLRRFGSKIAARGGKSAKRRAVVALARKLAVLLHRLWVTGEVYEPLRTATRCAPPVVAIP